MGIYQVSFFLFCAILCSQEFASAIRPWEPYTIQELVQKNFVSVNYRPGDHVEEDHRLRYEFEFRVPDEEEIETNLASRNFEWNRKMSYALNEIKNARLRQKEALRDMVEILLNKDAKDHNIITVLQNLVEQDQEIIVENYAICQSLDDEDPNSDKDSDSDDD